MKDTLKKIEDLDESWYTNPEHKGRTICSIRKMKDMEFKELQLGLENIFIVELADFKKIDDEEQVEENIKMEIYDENLVLIAVIDRDNIIKFEEEYLEKFKKINPKVYEQLDFENIELENDTIKSLEGNEGELEHEENEEKEREQTAKLLGIKPEEVKNIAKIDQYKKITEEENLVNIIPETSKYKEISMVHEKNASDYDGFIMIGKKADGSIEKIDVLDSIKGTSTQKDVISINEDGTEVMEKQVKGLMQINTGNRNHGISISVGDYGMMDIDFVSDIDRNDRRSIPITTEETENRRVATSRIKENAADPMCEVQEENKNFRDHEEEGIKEQTIDGIDEDRADGTSRTFDDLKNDLKEEILNDEELQSPRVLEDYIRNKISLSEFNLNEEEITKIINDVREEVEFESRFPSREL